MKQEHDLSERQHKLAQAQHDLATKQHQLAREQQELALRECERASTRAWVGMALALVALVALGCLIVAHPRPKFAWPWAVSYVATVAALVAVAGPRLGGRRFE